MILEYRVEENDINRTYKSILQNKLRISNRLLTKLKNSQKLTVNGNLLFVNKTASVGDLIKVDINLNNENDGIKPQKGDLEVLFEDEYYIAINKPANMVVHPCSYHQDCTLSNYLKYYLKTNNKIHPVNRLDKDTSGVVLFAKNEYAQELFNIMQNKADKVYITIVEGKFEGGEGTIDAPIARREESIIERCVDLHNGQNAVTHYKVLKSFNLDGKDYSMLEVRLETGRTHQIRVHLAYIGHPIVGDGLYNKNDTKLINRQALHAHKLAFIHPITNKIVDIEAKIPKDMLFNPKS